MSLREAIKPQHDAAEHHPFTVVLLSGKMPTDVYADYLYNHLFIYQAIERRIKALGMFSGFPEMFRADKIGADFDELNVDTLTLCNSTYACLNRVLNVSNKDLMAYFYLYHMADMYGGQMIKKVVPGSGTRFDYEDRNTLIAEIRKHLTDDLANEAKVAFGFALEMFDELATKYDLWSAGQSAQQPA
jgi:heme oxygenase